jgi:hypothetical protein
VTFTVIDADQRSEAWRLARVGRVTGSNAKHVIAKGRGSDEAVTRRDYRFQLVTERLTGQPQDSDYVNDAMQRGIELEPKAFAAYEAHTGLLARRTGFLAADAVMAGCSLDGDVDGFTGIVELKCPKSATHARYIKAFQVNPSQPPAEHAAQIIHNLWISNAAWCDFVSFDDRFPPELQLVVIRVMRDEKAIDEYAKKAFAFLEEVDVEYQAMLTLANPFAQLEASLA